MRFRPILEPVCAVAFDPIAAKDRLEELEDTARLSGCEPGTLLALDIATYRKALGVEDAPDDLSILEGLRRIRESMEGKP